LANKRIIYATQRVGVAPVNSKSFTTIRGLQSVGITTNFNLEPIFEIGQLEDYETIEGIPAVDIQTEKVLDGYCPVYLLATQTDGDGDAPTSSSLIGRSQGVCNMALSIYDETNQYAEGTPGTEVHMSGVYISSVGYAVSVDANATETCSLVGNNKVWVIGGNTGSMVGYNTTAATWLGTPWSGGTVDPLSISGSGGVNRREDVIFGSGTSASILPTNIPGVNSSGYNINNGDKFGVSVQSWNINADLGRTEMFELGRKGTYNRYVNLPIEVTNEISVISTSGDLISATEEGLYGSTSGCGMRYNLTSHRIRLSLCEGLIVDCGSGNKLSSVAEDGGNTGGDNVGVTYSYSNYNAFNVKHPNDPVTALRP
jgi:hypothetical protein